MDVLGRLSSLFQQALETREPSVNLLQSFVEHWKGITNYYIQTTDEACPVRQTDIPWRLKQMLDILVYEEKQQGVEETGVCMEYLLQHKLLETLGTLGKAQYPPGMIQQVLLFFSSFLLQIQKPVLHLLNVHRPVQKLIGLCALPASQSEKQEVEFLFAVCRRIQQDPYILHYILKVPISSVTQSADSPSDQSTFTPDSTHNQSRCSSCSLDQSDSSMSSGSLHAGGLLSALVQLTQSQNHRVSLQASEGLLLLCRLQPAGAALAQHTQLGALLLGMLVQLYSMVPLEDMQAQEVLDQPETRWSGQSGPDSGHLTRFLYWLDFLDHMTREAAQVLADRLALTFQNLWLRDVWLRHMMKSGETGVPVNTAVLTRVVRQIQSAALLEALVQFLLGSSSEPEQPLHPGSHPVRHLLVENCKHSSHEISLLSLRLFEELLRKPHHAILANLLLRNLQQRRYVAPPPAGLEEPHSDGSGDDDALEEDLLFPQSQIFVSQSSSSSSPGPDDIINSFLCLVPQEVRSSHLVHEGGYDSYFLDARTLCGECRSLSQPWAWPENLPPPPSSSSAAGSDFFEGHFLRVLFDRLGGLLEQQYDLNLQVTSLLSRLAAFRNPLICDFLLNPYVTLQPRARSLFTQLVRVISVLMQQIQSVPDLREKLLTVRRQLLDLEPQSQVEQETLLRGIIVLEEFCKELAAIAFVNLNLHLDQDQD